MQFVPLGSLYHDQTVVIGDVSLVTIVRISFEAAPAMMNEVVRYRDARPLEAVTNPKVVDLQVRRPSAREAEILCCNNNKEGSSKEVIARKPHLAESTVKAHVKAILRKIGNPEKC